MRREQQFSFVFNPSITLNKNTRDRNDKKAAHRCAAYSGHVDILGVLLLLISTAALRRQRRSLAAIAFGMAVAVKFLPPVLAPLYWRRVRIRDGLLAALVVGLLYVPFLQSGRVPMGSVGTFVERFRFNDPIFAVFERIVRPQVAVGLAVLFGLITAVWLRGKHSACSPDAWAWPMAVSVPWIPATFASFPQIGAK